MFSIHKTLFRSSCFFFSDICIHFSVDFSCTFLCHALQIDLAAKAGEVELFSNADHPQYGLIKVYFTILVLLLALNLVIFIYLVLCLQKDVSKAKSREVIEFFDSGFGIHNAGMMRSDRNLMERLFADGLLKVS